MEKIQKDICMFSTNYLNLMCTIIGTTTYKMLKAKINKKYKCQKTIKLQIIQYN